MNCSAPCPSLNTALIRHGPRYKRGVVNLASEVLNAVGYAWIQRYHLRSEQSMNVEQSRVEPRVPDVGKLEVVTVSGPSPNVG